MFLTVSTHLAPHNEGAYVMYYDRNFGKTVPKKTHLINSSLASQAVGPPGSNFEMTCDGKPFKTMAKKMLRLVPLGLQEVHPNDSALGSLSAYPHKGLRTDYRTLIRDAFHEEYWMSPRHDEDGYTQIEQNFSLFWGLAIQMYESTLVSLGHSKFEKGGRPNTSRATRCANLQQFWRSKCRTLYWLSRRSGIYPSDSTPNRQC